SQKFVSSTACIISIVSPLVDRKWATMQVRKPSTEPAALGKPFLKTPSRNRQMPTQPQPMNTADEYRFVTGGRPCSHMRVPRAQVCTTNVNAISQNADRFKGCVNTAQPTQLSRKTITYRIMHW